MFELIVLGSAWAALIPSLLLYRAVRRASRRVRCAVESLRGVNHAWNEDSAVCEVFEVRSKKGTTPLVVAAVADGVSQGRLGALASKATVELFRDYVVSRVYAHLVNVDRLGGPSAQFIAGYQRPEPYTPPVEHYDLYMMGVERRIVLEKTDVCRLLEAAGAAGQAYPQQAYDEILNIVESAVRYVDVKLKERLGGVAAGYQAAESLYFAATTFTGVLVICRRLYYVNVGNSRLYVYQDGRLERLTQDDIVAGSSAVTNVVSNLANMNVDVTNRVSVRPLTGGFVRLLLVTDGVHQYLDEGTLEKIVKSGGTAEEVAARVIAKLIENVRSTGGAVGPTDDATVVVVDIPP